MNQSDLIEYVTKFYVEGADLVRKKNNDYTDPKHDAFKNFRNAEMVGVDWRRAILVRISDKISRASRLLDKPADVTNESLQDTLLDCANYCAILAASLEEK